MVKVKICGMRDIRNIAEVCKESPDYIGLIFYDKSSRYVNTSDEYAAKRICLVARNTRKIGVFVNASNEYIAHCVKQYQLHGIQLHGDESSKRCKEVREQFPQQIITKAFGIQDEIHDDIAHYKAYCDYFVFDTKSKNYGGSGRSFSWEILQKYDLKHPFFLSGGIGLDNILEALKTANEIPYLYGLDINSKVEVEPGFKNVSMVQKTIREIQNAIHSK